jgi:hypothetical protein
MSGALGINLKKRKYILGWREWFKRGVEPYEVKIPKRMKKYLIVKKKVALKRRQKKGLE